MSNSGRFQGLNSAFGFFRIFDVAFVIPGALVYIVPQITSSQSLLERFVPGGLFSSPFHSGGEWVQNLGALVSFFVVLYVTGIVCHAIARQVREWVVELQDRKGSQASDSPSLDGASEIGIYLWNLASLSWNCAAALVIGAVLRWKWDLGTIIILMVGLVLVRQGCEFRAGYRSMAKAKEDSRGGTS